MERAREFHALASSLCCGDRYNLVLHKHLGDVSNTIASKTQFEEKFGAKLRFLIRPQHAFLMEMFGVEDYAVLDIDSLAKSNTRLKELYFGTDDPPRVLLDRLENDLYQTIFACVPIMGAPFVCENLTNDFFAFERYWAYRWAENMGIDGRTGLSLPSHVPGLSPQAKAALASIAPLERIVLLAPEAATAAEFGNGLWNIIAEGVQARGYRVIVNSNRFSIKHGISAFDLKLSLSDVVALGHSCAYVISIRSGLCDVLVGIGERLYAIYPATLRREMHGLNRAFDRATGVREIAIENWQVDRFEWEGVDWAPTVQRYIDGLRRRYVRAGLTAKFLSAKAKGRRLALRDRLRDRAGSPYFYPQTNLENPPREQVFRFLGIPTLRKTFSSATGGRTLARRSILFGFVVVYEWSDGSWESYLLGFPLSAGVANEHPTQKSLTLPHDDDT